MRRMGIWASNGINPNVNLMLGMKPGMVTCIWDYMSHNNIDGYKSMYQGSDVLVRFMHPKNWWEQPTVSASNYAAELVQRLQHVDEIGARWYFANEMNLHYENNWGFDRQLYCESKEFYGKLATWTYDVIDRVKQARPETCAVMHPFAFGHGEDGAPIDGVPQAGWAGYDYFYEMITSHFGDVITGHYYWGDGSGTIQERLYDEELSTWYAFRWKRVIDLFKTRYGRNVRIIIDECGNFEPDYPTFKQDVVFYAQQCLRDEHVLGVTPFLWSDPTGSNAINDWQKIQGLDLFVAELANMPDIEIDKPSDPPEDTTGDTMYKIFDIDGVEKDSAWLSQNWGIEVSETLSDLDNNFKLVEVREREGASIYPVKVLDASGVPMSGRLVWRHYPGAPDNWVSAPNVPEPAEAKSGAVYGVSTDYGMVEFGLGNGDYAGPGDGVSSIWVTQNDVGTDVVRKMGMLPNTNHRTLKLTFQFTPMSDEPTDGQTDGWFCKFLKFLVGKMCQ